MQGHTQPMGLSKNRKLASIAQTHSGVALFIATLTILIASVAFAPLNGMGQSSEQSRHPGNRLQTVGPVSGSSRPGSRLFLPAVNYDSGAWGPDSVAIADVNGDGKLDVVVANLCNTTCFHIQEGALGVLLGNGDGTFQPAVTYDSGGTSAVSVAIADLNGDGKPDLVVANYSIGTVGVLLGNGNGTFQKVVTYNPGGGAPNWVAVADVNGDGRPDLLVANEIGTGQVGVLLGNGDGTFQPVQTYGSFTSYSVAAGDVNGDGKLDLVVTHFFTGSSVGVLVGNGDGTFQTEVTYDMGGSSAYSAAVADVNGDGKLDVVTANRYYYFDVGVLLGKGDGTLQAAVSYDLGGYAADSVAVSDVNGDGKPDLVVATELSRVDVLLGKGDGTFEAATPYSTASYNLGSVAVADVNGDGRPDLVVVNECTNICDSRGLVSVLLNSSPRPTSTSLASSLNPSIYGQKVSFTATVTSSDKTTPTGQVNFTWDGHSIGSATLNASAVATLTKSNLNADPYPLTAVYGGDANNLPSTSAILNQVVSQTTSTASLTSSPNPSLQGQAVTFTATISSPTVIPRGPVAFTAGKTVLGTAQLSSGKAKLTISSLSLGSTKVTATYNGDSNITKSSASVIQTVK